MTTPSDLLRIDRPLVFHTQHSTESNRLIAVNGLAMLTEIGSTMHGVSQPGAGDDVDEMGVCIDPPSEVVGFGDFDQYEYRTQPVNVRSGEGDIDRVIYSLRKFVYLAAQGNPTVLMPLFVPEESHLTRYLSDVGRALRDARGMFITKQAGRKFLGYLNGQRSRYLDPERQDSKHASRPELIEAYGWDTKTGYHAMRLAIQGTELMYDHTITVPMKPEHREFLLKVRQGEYDKDWVTAWLDDHIEVLKEAAEGSDLPEAPDYDYINDWLSSIYIKAWRDMGLIDQKDVVRHRLWRRRVQESLSVQDEPFSQSA